MSSQSVFEVIPVIHILSGRVIRWEGDGFVRCQGIQSNPLSVALDWIRQGATQLHVVDLDAVHNRVSAVPALVLALRNLSVRTSLAGGIHSVDAARERVSYGASSLIVRALLDMPTTLAKVVTTLGADHVWGTIDIGSGSLPLARLKNAVNAGIDTIVVSAPTREILTATETLHEIHDLVHDGLTIWASGQISEYQDLLSLKQAGCRGALVSRALHEGILTIDGIVQSLAPNRDTAPKTA